MDTAHDHSALRSFQDDTAEFEIHAVEEQPSAVKIPASITYGRSVILQEAAALETLAHSLGESFDQAVKAIVHSKSRIVVSGLGKSGHIGCKMAATLAATGSPAFFLHASEAAHGDLGMLMSDDLLIVISNSGFTQELRPLIAHAKSINIKIIAIVSKPESPLARSADIVVQLPQLEEACPVKMAPTTSTTMTLALGDALAIGAMRLKGVNREAMAKWHPGGNLGNRFSPVADIIDPRRPLPLIGLAAPMRDAIFEMTAVSKGAVGVIDDNGELVGVITDGDLRRNFHLIHSAKAQDIMSHSPKTVLSSAIADDAMKIMTEQKVTVLFVMDSEQPTRTIGLLHIHDLGHML